MVRSNELRIGNWVIFNDNTDRYGQVREIHEHYPVLNCNYTPDHWENKVKEYSVVYDFIEPIPLTPEILEKCGFMKVKEEILEEDWVRFIKGLQYHYDGSYTCDIELELENDGTWAVSYQDVIIKYLHQVQNLYFFLTGEELEFKP